MKRIIMVVVICIALVSLIGCEIEPLFTIYGETIHESVRKFYEDYEILNLCSIVKDGKTTWHNLCVVNDIQEGIDIICISYSRSEENYDEYVTTESIAADNVELGKSYSTEAAFKDILVEYVVCEKKDIPDSTLQKEKFKFNEKNLYLCITKITDID